MINSSNGNQPINPQGGNHNYIILQPQGVSQNALINSLSQKIAPYCTSDFLSKKARAWMKSKISPLSTPNDLAKDLQKAQRHHSFLKHMHGDFSTQLQKIKATIAHFENPEKFPARLATLKELKTLYKNRIHGLTLAIDVTSKFINHLKTKQATTISSRVVGGVGAVSNIVIPGIGPTVNFTLTTILSALPVLSASKLNNPKEQRNAQWATAFTAASFIASTAVSYYVWPVVNAYVTSYFAQNSQK